MSVTPKQIKFGWNVAAGMTQTAAYQDAYGCDEASARSNCSENMEITGMRELIRERMETLAAVAGIDQSWVLNKLKALANADPNQLSELKIYPCSDCWLDANQTESYKLLGFNVKRQPRPDCDTCDGHGHQRVILKPSACGNPLYAGAKQTKNGIEIKLHSQTDAVAKIFDYLGMNKSVREISGPGGKPIEMSTTTTPRELTDEQLAEIAAKGLE